MDNVIKELYEIVKRRKADPSENSYTCYLFGKGLDKILKKIGEESAETIIAAKNGELDQLSEEICDLLYHLIVLMVEKELPLEDVVEVLESRRRKIGNLKEIKNTDKNT